MLKVSSEFKILTAQLDLMAKRSGAHLVIKDALSS